MIRIISPKGILRQVVMVYQVYENRMQLNGWYRRWAEAINDSSIKPNALLLVLGQVLGDCRVTDKLFIGNLKSEVVGEIMQKLLVDEYFDFSQMKYQEKVESASGTVFDDGVGLPYSSDFVSSDYDLAVGVRDDNVRPDICNTWQSHPLTAGANCFECGENAESDDDPFSECRNVADEVGDIFRNESMHTMCGDIFGKE